MFNNIYLILGIDRYRLIVSKAWPKHWSGHTYRYGSIKAEPNTPLRQVLILFIFKTVFGFTSSDFGRITVLVVLPVDPLLDHLVN